MASKFTIRKKFGFSAAHQLHGLREGHQCARPHGHNYEVEITLRADELNETGFVVDYGELKPLAVYIEERFEHRNLNDIFAQPTAELLAKHFYFWCKEIWPEVCSVAVSETPKTWAEYSEE